MSLIAFILRSLWYYRRQHMAVLAGAMISTAVLTGALVVGDSVKLSLKHMVDVRLGKTRHALVAGKRFVRKELANDLSISLQLPTSSFLQVRGMAIVAETAARINEAEVLGIDDSFWKLSGLDMPVLEGEEAIISENTALKLDLHEGDWFLLRVEHTSIVPLNTPLAREEQASIALRLKVKSIAGTDQLGRFSLRNNQAAPHNVFMAYEYLSEKLELNGLANVVLVGSNSDQIPDVQQLNQALEKVYSLDDLSLHTRELTESQQYEILSDRIFIDKVFATELQKLDSPKQVVLTYLVNTIASHDRETPYSFVSAVSQPNGPGDLNDDEIIINQWLAEDLGISKGDTVRLDYFVVGPLRTLEEESCYFTVKKIIPTQSADINSNLMPQFPGLTDAGSCSDWDAGIPIDLDRIRDKDELYWTDYMGAPKALISMSSGHSLWDNQFGNCTAIRFSINETGPEEFKHKIRGSLKPNMIGLGFINVRDDGIRAVDNGVDFGGLFLSLSFFVMAAGILLTILMYTLSTDSRKQETGVLAGLGFSTGMILKTRFAESIITILLGAMAGVGAGILYNKILVSALNTVWQDIVRFNLLEVHIVPSTLIISALAGILLSLTSVYLVSRYRLRQSVNSLVREAGTQQPVKGYKKLPGLLIGISGFALSLGLVIYSLTGSEGDNAGLFLSAGGLFLAGSFGIVDYIIKTSINSKKIKEPSLLNLATKNLGRNKARSLAAIILLGLGTFTIIITGANKKTFSGTERIRSSGTGGFAFWTETTLPVMNNLNTYDGRKALGLEEEKYLGEIDFQQLHSLDGDDASCLNLNQVQHPRILGVHPVTLDNKQAFTFLKTVDNVEEGHPWLSLDNDYGDGIIPAVADQTVLTWGLKKKVGDTLVYLDESGNHVKLVLVGGLANSIFQGNILVSERLLLKHFPSSGGSKVMLVDAPKDKQEQVFSWLKSTLVDYGIEVTPASARLAEFYSVENTYLTVFMVLGGLGVLIGTLGLGILLLRNILDRRNELAILTAQGYNRKIVFRLIFTENIIVLLTGMSCGIFGALIGILPSLISDSFNMDYQAIIVILLAVILTGLLSIYLPARKALASNLVNSLRNE